MINPNAVRTVKLNNKPIDDNVLSGVLVFFFIYTVIVIAVCMLLALDGKDFSLTITAVIANITNSGPALGAASASGNYSSFSDYGKMLLSLSMIIGRLEIYPFILIFTPAFWKRVNL
jgi:trk system potassium uptake protein TrkH